ncbi:hypothetical protein NQZ68_007629, partial [Dissostichus eleginoides]
ITSKAKSMGCVEQWEDYGVNESDIQSVSEEDKRQNKPSSVRQASEQQASVTLYL